MEGVDATFWRSAVSRKPGVLVTFDARYQLGVEGLLGSLLATTQDANSFELYVASPEPHISLAMAVVERAIQHGFSAQVLPYPSEYGMRFPVFGHVSGTTYARLFCIERIEAERLIYLDCDVLLRHDIGELINFELGSSPVAAALDLLHPTWSSPGNPIGQLNGESPYFNAGVLVIDAEAWRSRGLSGRSEHFLQLHADRVRFWDQDALNYACQGEWKALPHHWNVFPHDRIGTGVRFPYLGESVFSLKDLSNLQANAFAMHYVGRRKPWQSDYPVKGDSLRHREARAIWNHESS